MQTVLSEIAFTFVDDAVALAAGFKRIALELVRDRIAAARALIMAPIDRIARACDVGGTLSPQHQADRTTSRGARPNPARGPRTGAPRFDVLRIRATLRTLRELT
jgi:hypothetical protein